MAKDAPTHKGRIIATGPQARRQAESRAASALKTPPSKRTEAQKDDIIIHRKIFGRRAGSTIITGE